jgi:hypothetical protein
MGKRRKLLLLLVAFSGAALFLLLSRNHQPVYQGRTLTQWVGAYNRTFETGTPDPKDTAAAREEAVGAIRHIGTNALPLLLDLMDDPPSRARHRLRGLSERLPNRIEASVVGSWIRRHHPLVLRPEDAWSISGVLGPIAAPAVPDLIKRLSSTNWSGRRDIALYALECIGPAAASAAPAIAMHLSHSDERVHYAATNALLKLAPEILSNAPAP